MTLDGPLDPGLLARLRDAGRSIAWTPLPPPRRGRSRRTARSALLRDEVARVETWGHDPGGGIEVTSGPVGALVLLLEIDRRGTPQHLVARNAGRDRQFPDGAIVATWSDDPPEADDRPSVRDLVELARYALP